jgi:DmsE family decaheme c-type cytochrome
MHLLSKRELSAFAVALAVFLLLVALGSSAAPAAGPPDRAPKDAKATPAQAQQATSQYIGLEACKTCHEDMPSKGFFKNFETTPHWKTTYDTRRGPEYQGCEACHGPGADHMNGGGDKTKIFTFKGAPAKQASQRCMKCHEYGEEHSNFGRSAHNVNNVACSDCHSVHGARERSYLLKVKQPDLCYTCHLDKKAEFSKPFRHRVNEGLLRCTDCHNEHGGFLTRSLRSSAAQDVVCFKCHVDKAGPFVFQHAPVKTEGCVACHTPHGSSNPRLLKRSQINLLCLECHTLTGGGLAPIGPSHDQSQKYQACTLCHAQIHGSNFSPVFFK